MSPIRCLLASVSVSLTLLSGPAQAQQAAQPEFSTTKVEGTDNVYVFRYRNSQAMFVVTSAGVSRPTRSVDKKQDDQAR